MSGPKRLVVRFRPERPMSTVELRGDFHHWLAPIPMRVGADGWWEAEVPVEVGVYEYKFHLAGGEWALDPGNPRTRSRDGSSNNLAVVGGAAEPVLHAPASPFVHREDDGRLCVRAGLRRGHGESLTVRWDEGAGVRRTRMARVGEEDQHLLFEAHLPGAGRAVDYLFVLTDGGAVGAEGGAAQPFRVELRRAPPGPPDWWRSAVLYTVFVDRFRRAGQLGWRESTRWDREFRAGGDLDGVVDALPYLVDLGVDVLHLTPIGISPSVHRYDCVDPRRVAPELGGEPALDRLIEAAHAAGLRLLLDLTVTHVDRDFFAFRDVRERGQRSPYWDWFHIERYPFLDGFEPGYRHYQKGQWREPLLDTDNPEVRAYLTETFAGWVDRGVDGFRIDAASDVPVDLVREIRRAVSRRNREAVVFGELIPGNLERWTADAVDAATDFVDQEITYDWLWRRRGSAAASARAYQRRRFTRGGPGWSSIGFVGTHDQPRLATLTGDARVARLGQLLILTRQAVPMFYYGDEIGLRAAAPGGFEDSWPDRQCMEWDRSRWDAETHALCRSAIALRRATPALGRGDEQFFDSGPAEVIGFRRRLGDQVIDVLLNGSDQHQVALLGDDAPAAVLLALGEVTVTGGAARLGPYAGVVLDRTRSLEPEILDHNRALCDLAFRDRSELVPGYPANLYLTVTETCNLRCRHCITGAPALTASGRARTAQPWLLDALAGGFAAADYFGFAHGGESLTAPVFFDVLSAIRRARGGRPYQVHLLSNGMLLDRATVGRLIDHGVTSLMVSIDGATAEVDDSIRCGGDFARVTAHIEGAIALRRARGADLRIGISMVLGRENLDQVAAMGRLAVELGVDWLKLEETFPATSFARRDFVEPASPEVVEAMAGLRDAVGDRLVVVDHLAPDPEDPEFRAADDFANRVEFVPRRAAWDQACVDPDGTVHLVDYAGPVLGNLRQTRFDELWNGPVAREQRRRAAVTARSRR